MSVLTGKISWFGGPNDNTTGPTTASGAPVSTPGIAVYNRSTLGGYWMVKLPNGHAGVVRQTDIGPAPSTGRSIDFTYSLLNLLGYSQQNFPTNSSASAVYLGKTSSDISKNIGDALTQLGLSPVRISPTASQAQQIITETNKQGFSGVKVSGAPSNPGQLLDNAASSVTDVGSAITSVWNTATSGAFWKRILYFVGGAVLLFWGIKELTGAHVPEAVKGAAVAAAV